MDTVNNRVTIVTIVASNSPAGSRPNQVHPLRRTRRRGDIGQRAEAEFTTAMRTGVLPSGHQFSNAMPS